MPDWGQTTQPGTSREGGHAAVVVLLGSRRQPQVSISFSLTTVVGQPCCVSVWVRRSSTPDCVLRLEMASPTHDEHQPRGGIPEVLANRYLQAGMCLLIAKGTCGLANAVPQSSRICCSISCRKIMLGHETPGTSIAANRPFAQARRICPLQLSGSAGYVRSVVAGPVCNCWRLRLIARHDQTLVGPFQGDDGSRSEKTLVPDTRAPTV
jgi:hypothetical protein